MMESVASGGRRAKGRLLLAQNLRRLFEAAATEILRQRDHRPLRDVGAKRMRLAFASVMPAIFETSAQRGQRDENDDGADQAYHQNLPAPARHRQSAAGVTGPLVCAVCHEVS
jgi:hypothetical protein